MGRELAPVVAEMRARGQRALRTRLLLILFVPSAWRHRVRCLGVTLRDSGMHSPPSPSRALRMRGQASCTPRRTPGSAGAQDTHAKSRSNRREVRARANTNPPSGLPPSSPAWCAVPSCRSPPSSWVQSCGHACGSLSWSSWKPAGCSAVGVQNTEFKMMYLLAQHVPTLPRKCQLPPNRQAHLCCQEETGCLEWFCASPLLLGHAGGLP